MVIERWRQIESLFEAAHGRTAAERVRFLDEVCAGDQTLRREVESLLANEELAARFLESSRASAPAQINREPVPFGERIGPYGILELLGSGGMGEVYRAYDKRLERHVAIKFLARPRADDPAALKRFEHEARAASALNHPNICTVHDVGEFQGRSFIVMELLEGQSLKERIAGKPLPLAEFFAVSRQVCAGLEAAHAKGIVHRDVKPANVFVTHGGLVKILDFGLAKRSSESLTVFSGTPLPAASTRTLTLTETGIILGTLAYMSPEQAMGGEVDARSDLFSCGVLLYEMATGQVPFHGKTAAAIMGSILTQSPVEPSALNTAIPASLDRVILKALDKDRELRYQSAALLAGDLEAAQRSHAAAQTLRTRRWIMAAAGTSVAGLAGGAVLTRRRLLPPKRRIRIAVLPFENIGGDAQHAFFADGLHQDMISVMNRLYPDRLGVIARTSVKRYHASGANIEQIGRDLQVDYVVEGGVQRHGEEVHVTARLIRVADQTPLWNATYNRGLGQVLALQAEVAQAIAQGIERGLRPDGQVSAALARPLNPAAHEAYLRGDYARAVEIDPHYSAAFSGLANQLYYPGLFGFVPPRDAFTRMASAASKALELDATQAGAHASLALSRLHLHWSWSESGEGFRHALRLDPNDVEVRHFFGHYLLWAGRREESARECRRGLEVDPYNPGFIACMGWHYLCAGELDRALDATRRALALQPDHGWALLTMGWIYEHKGMYQESLSALRKTFDSTLKKASLAHAFARSGNRRMAEMIVSDLLADSAKNYISPYDLAVGYAGLGDQDQTFQWLDKACQEHSGFLLFVGSDPRLQLLRPDPRFRRLLRRMGLPDRQA
jgi:TolB-like protein